MIWLVFVEIKAELEKQGLRDRIVKLLDKFTSSEAVQGLIKSLGDLLVS